MRKLVAKCWNTPGAGAMRNIWRHLESILKAARYPRGGIAYEFWQQRGANGGPEGARTPDLLAASQALSQLSYRPVITIQNLAGTIGARGTLNKSFPADLMTQSLSGSQEHE